MTTYKGFCPECKLEITGPTAAQVNRNIGLHRRSKHGYRSPDYLEAKAYRQKAAAKVPNAQLANLAKARAVRWANYRRMTPEELKAKKRREYNRIWRAKQRVKQRALPITNNTNNNPSEAVLCKLSECPICGSRFYVVRGAA